jgi:hypothetical protein
MRLILLSFPALAACRRLISANDPASRAAPTPLDPDHFALL